MKTLRLGLAVSFLFAFTLPAAAELIGHWPLDADGNDPVGGSNGTVDASVSFGVAGQFGGAASFSGAGPIQVPYDAKLNPASFTLTAWVNPSDTAGWNSVVTSREDSGTVNGYILYNTPENQWDFWTGGGGAAGTWGRNIAPTPATLDQWTHLAITYDGATDTKKLYVNTLLEAEVSGQGYVPNGGGGEPRPFNIGAGQDLGDSFFFNGLIDDVGLWNEALSQAQIEGVASTGVVPEPTGLTLFFSSLIGLAALRRRR